MSSSTIGYRRILADPTDKALLPPKWVPWKDRLLPSDLSVTDSIGTPEDDERLDDGIGIDEAVSRTEELNAEQQAVETVQAQEGGSPMSKPTR